MPKGYVPPEERCGAKTRSGTPCKQRKTPMTKRCRLHGGYADTSTKVAAEYYERLALGQADPFLPAELRVKKLRNRERTDQIIARRKMRKAGVDLAEYDMQQEQIAQQQEAEFQKFKARLQAEGKWDDYLQQNRDLRDRMMSPQRAEEGPAEPEKAKERPEERRPRRRPPQVSVGPVILYEGWEGF